MCLNSVHPDQTLCFMASHMHTHAHMLAHVHTHTRTHAHTHTHTHTLCLLLFVIISRTIPDPGSQKLNWHKAPLTVLVVKKIYDESILDPFKEVISWLIEVIFSLFLFIFLCLCLSLSVSLSLFLSLVQASKQPCRSFRSLAVFIHCTFCESS